MSAPTNAANVPQWVKVDHTLPAERRFTSTVLATSPETGRSGRCVTPGAIAVPQNLALILVRSARCRL